jgi:hypothetical protein
MGSLGLPPGSMPLGNPGAEQSTRQSLQSTVRAPGVGDEGGPSSPTTLPVSPASLGGSQGHAPDLPKNDSGAGPVTASSLATVVTGDGRGRPLRHGPSADRVHEACATSRPNPLASIVVDGDDHARRSKKCEAGPGTPPNSISPNHICLRHPRPYVDLSIVAVVVVHLAILKTQFVSASCVPTPERRPADPAGSVPPPRRADRPARSSGPPSGPSPTGT